MRHLSNMRGSLGFSENEIMATATFSDEERKQDAAVLYSNHSGLIEQHKSIFEKLWSIATPGERKIKEIEEENHAARKKA